MVMAQGNITRASCEQLRQKLLAQGLPAAAARVLSARDIGGRDDIVPSLQSLPPPDTLPDINRFCDIMKNAIRRGDKICVVGDYDADGMCATALAVDCLRRLGAEVIWRIPHRMQHGFGLHPEIVEETAKVGVAVLLTVDNGASATAAIHRAAELGLQVCVTDHHLPSLPLPPADCIVNPQCATVGGLPTSCLVGVGVIFYALSALRTAMNIEIKMCRYLDLVAVGSIADCGHLDKTNRALVGGGLELLRRGNGSIGLRVLVERTCRGALDCTDIAFRIAPHLNAAGRFSQPELAVNLLMADNVAVAHKLVAELETLNKRRGKLVNDIMDGSDITPAAHSVVLYDENWPADALGMLGIIAGRLAEEYQRPAVVLGRQLENWRGSGRVPSGNWDLHQLLEKTAAAADGAVIKFGGHRRAVGLEVCAPKVFADAFEAQCQQAATSNTAQYGWEVDALPPPDEITAEAVACLQEMVWGIGFPRPQFAGAFAVSEARQIGGGKHSCFKMTHGEWELPAIAFHCAQVGKNIEALFSLSLDQYSGGVIAIIDETARL